MKASTNSKKVVEDHLKGMAAEDPLFAETLKKANKNIDGCMNYIMGQAKKKGANMLTDAEVFNMAVHYYDEDSLVDTKIEGVSMSHSGDPVIIKEAVSDNPKKLASIKPKKKEILMNQSSLF